MLRQAVRPNPSRQPTAQFVSLPAPVGGLNFRDSIAKLKPTEALILDNYFPEASEVQLRRGYTAHVTGFADPVETLMEYSEPADRKLFAASGTDIYDVTAAGAVGAAVVSSLTNARFQHVNFGAGGADYIVAVNGADGVRTYDGAAWATQAITGATATNFVDVAIHKNRLWFTQNASMTVYYLGSGAVAGAATALDLAPVFRLGGAVQFISPVSFSSGNVTDDGLVFVTTNGEVALYLGTDPASSTTFSLQGLFRIAPPVPGRRAYTRFNGDCVVLTVAGIISLIAAARIDISQQGALSVSDKIDPELRRQVANERSTFGWQIFVYPSGQAMMVNAPQGSDLFDQWVMNTLTVAWGRYRNQNALCWSLLDADPYFGGQTAVYRADFGQDDAGAAQTGAIKWAFSQLGTTSIKRVTMMRPLMTTNAAFSPRLGVDIDFSDNAPTDVGASPTVTAALWDTAVWDVAVWGGDSYVSREWSGLAGIGVWFSPRMSTSTLGLSITVNALDIALERAQRPAL